MTWVERRQFIQLALCPWPSRRDNVIMWIKSVVLLLISIQFVVSIANAITYPTTISRIMWPMALVVVFGSTVMNYTMHQLSLGVQHRKTILMKSLMANIEKSVSDLGAQILDKLKTASGRDHIDMNPISMAAAQLDAQEQHHTRSTENPLLLALDNELHPTDLYDDDSSDDERLY